MFAAKLPSCLSIPQGIWLRKKRVGEEGRKALEIIILSFLFFKRTVFYQQLSKSVCVCMTHESVIVLQSVNGYVCVCVCVCVYLCAYACVCGPVWMLLRDYITKYKWSDFSFFSLSFHRMYMLVVPRSLPTQAPRYFNWHNCCSNVNTALIKGHTMSMWIECFIIITYWKKPIGFNWII